MGRVSLNQYELNYQSNNERVPYFSIKNDRETKKVRILYNTIDDIYFDIAHDINNGGRFQSIACLNSDGSNPSACPFCSKGHRQVAKLFIPVLDLSDNTVKIWTRSRGFAAQLQALAARNNPISGVVVEITRVGAPRDPKTQYVMQPITMNDGKTVEALGVNIPDPSNMMRQMDFNQMSNLASQIDDQGNVIGQPQNNYNPNMNIGSEPVRRSVSSQTVNPSTTGTYTTPNYNYNPSINNSQMNNNTMPTTPMQGVPQQPTYSSNTPNYVDVNDEELPF